MSLDAGDIKYRYGQTVTFDAGSNTVNNGDAVTFDGSGNIQQATDTDHLLGTVLPTSPGSDADSKESVSIAGLGVVVETASSVSAGTFLEPNSGGDGTYQDAGAVGPDTSLPFVIETEDSGNNLYVACFR